MSRKGFTLIELLVVVVVIGIVAAIGIPKYANSKSKGYVSAMKTDLRNLVNAQEEFYADSSRYTSDLDKLNFTPSFGVEAVITVATGSWSATVGHDQMVSMQCGIAVNAVNAIEPAAGEGEPACK
jgi:prepilin-type N-terminal cleavage/methylation domain-containing protein